MLGGKCVKNVLSSKAPDLVVEESKRNFRKVRKNNNNDGNCLDIAVGGSRGEELLVGIQRHTLDGHRGFVRREFVAQRPLPQIPEAYLTLPAGRYEKLVLGGVE